SNFIQTGLHYPHPQTNAGTVNITPSDTVLHRHNLPMRSGAIAPAALLPPLSGVQPIPIQFGPPRQPAGCSSRATPMQPQPQSSGSASTPRQTTIRLDS